MEHSPDKAVRLRGQTLTPESPRPIHVQEPSNFVILEKQMDPHFSAAGSYSVSPDQQREEPSSATDMNGPLDMSQRIVALQGQSRVELVRPSGAQGNDDATTHGGQSGPSQHVPNHEYARNTPHFPASAVPTRSTSDTTANAQAHPQSQPSLNHHSHSAHINQPIQSNTNADTANSLPMGVQPASASSIDFNALLRSLTTTAGTAPATGAAPANIYPAGSNLPQATPAVGEEQSRQLHTQEQQRKQTALSNTLPSSPFHNQSLPGKPNMSFHNPNPQLAGLPLIQPPAPLPPTHTTQPSPVSQDVNVMSHLAAVSQNRSVPPAEQEPVGSPRDERSSEDETPWPPGIQRKYDDFLQQERNYVTEGQWDRFASGSRLFVGRFSGFLAQKFALLYAPRDEKQKKEKQRLRDVLSSRPLSSIRP